MLPVTKNKAARSPQSRRKTKAAAKLALRERALAKEDLVQPSTPLGAVVVIRDSELGNHKACDGLFPSIFFRFRYSVA